MPEDQLRTDDDVEGILRLAVQQSSTSSEDLRSRLKMSAAELGITEEQLAAAESNYFTQKQEEQNRAEEEARRKAAEIRDRKERFTRVFGGIGMAAGIFAFIYAMNNTTGFHVMSVFAFIIPAVIFKFVRSGRRAWFDSEGGYDSRDRRAWSDRDNRK